MIVHDFFTFAETWNVALLPGHVRDAAARRPDLKRAYWLEDVPAGAHSARIYWNGALCELPLLVPEDSAGVLELGTIACEPRAPML